jgi:hypothetical protein
MTDDIEQRLLDIITTQEARIAALEQRLRAPTPVPTGEERIGRRRLLGAAVGVVGASLLADGMTRPAAATDGVDLKIGDGNQTTVGSTQLRFTGADNSTPTQDVFLVHDANAGPVTPSISPALLAARASEPYSVAFTATASKDGTAAIFAEGTGLGGRALSANTSQDSSVTVFARAQGVSAFGVRGLTTNTSGVAGFFTANGNGGTGVVAECGGLDGVGLDADGSNTGGIGGRFAGVRTNLLLTPAGFGPNIRLDGHVVGEVVADANGDLSYCMAAGTPGTWRKLVGPTTAGAIHTLATPVRAFDSRQPGPNTGKISNGQSRVIDLSAAIPAFATTAFVNLTVTATSNAGFLALASGTVLPEAMTHSNINWFGNSQNLATNAITALSPSRGVRVKCGSSSGGDAHFIIDVFAYCL